MKLLTPARFVIDTFGGVSATARLVGRDASTVSRWQSKDGIIPSNMHRKILHVAKKKNFDITANDLIFGRASI